MSVTLSEAKGLYFMASHMPDQVIQNNSLIEILRFAQNDKVDNSIIVNAGIP